MNSARPSTLASFGCIFLAALLPGPAGPGAQESNSPLRSFSLAGRARIDLTAEWVQRPDAEPPPLPPLLTSAPRLVFSDILVLENRKSPAVLQFGFSDNPFLGSDTKQLDARMRERLAADLFYFFFPPPRACLARVRTAFEEARRKQEEERRAQEQKQKEKQPAPPAQPISVSQPCEFSPAPLDFFAAQLSSGVVFRQTEKGDRIEGHLRGFYLPPMEQVEIAGKTFFIFEARAEHVVERPEIEKFGLPDDRRGARAHFFWAIGANMPFPFLRDPQRKDLQLVQVAYTCLSLNGDARAEFRGLLEQVRFEP